MSHAALVRPTDEWQVREWCRTGLRSVLTAIGSDAFEPALLAYLYLIVRADRIATVWTTEEGEPWIASFGGDCDYGKIATAQLGRIKLAPTFVRVGIDGAGACSCNEGDRSADCCVCTDAQYLRDAGLAEELRLHIDLGIGRTFAVFLGRRQSGKPWSSDELASAERSLSLIQSVIIAHSRSIASPQPSRPVQISAERRLARAFEQRGLSQRESEIASKVLFGYSTLAIAMDIGISENTVKVHRKHLNQKLGVRSQAELFGFAYNALMDGEQL